MNRSKVISTLQQIKALAEESLGELGQKARGPRKKPSVKAKGPASPKTLPAWILSVFREPLQVYAKITEDEFARVKDGIVAEANSQLLFLANEKKSQVLVTTKYYGWLLPMLEKAVPPQPQRIWALSLMRELEWDDSPPERRFIELSRIAAERGVRIDRIFVMKKDLVASALGNQAVRLHLQTQKPETLRGFVVEMEALARADEDLDRQLGDGFIVFDERVALVDVFSGKSARGYVTMNRGEIEHLRDVYNRLLILAESLDAVAARQSAQAPQEGRASGPGTTDASIAVTPTAAVTTAKGK